MKRRRGRASEPTLASLRFRNFAAVYVGLLAAVLSSGPPSALAVPSTAANPGLLAPFLSPTATGPIADDAKCDVEQLEEANDSQLHTILRELVGTSFFRTFAVDLDHGCPLSSWGGKKSLDPPAKRNEEGGRTAGKKEKEKEDLDEQKAGEQDDGDGESQCDGGLPDLDPDAGPACSVQDDESELPWDVSGSAGGFGAAGVPDPGATVPSTSDFTAAAKREEEAEEGDDPDFECSGGNSEELGLDDDAEPLCSLAGAGDGDGDKATLMSKTKDLFSSALQHLADGVGWESESQKKTFDWTSPSDPIIVIDEEPCDDQSGTGGELPDLFWVDMCSNIKAGEGLKVVNLALNPERNTGYNGTHIWKAIYEENCLAIDGAQTEMCYEERVLYRLLSGLHTSTTLSIGKNYYPPSKRKGRENWEPNPTYFMQKFGPENADHIRNLHFSYVVLLRALKKASPFLRDYEIRTGNIVEDETATILLRRLLDSTILRSCHDVFTAFDESLMFREEGLDGSKQVAPIKENFKGVFHNISSILDCVQCQQCKLHGKMAMLGYGTALKILFLPTEKLIASSLSRNEIVAFINTIAKMSESIKEVRELTALYWAEQVKGGDKYLTLPATAKATAPGSAGKVQGTNELVDAAVGAAAQLAREGRISTEREAELVSLAFSRDPDLMILAKHYGSDLVKFLLHSKSIGSLDGDGGEPDAIVVGSGLAGLAATLNLLDRGGKVIVVEKEHLLGGNSNKASSGINACCPSNFTKDDVEAFRNDTIRSAGDAAQLELISTLVENSGSAVEWLRERVGVDLSLVAQLGGHVFKRTHRPKNGMVGAEVIYGMQKAVKAYEKSGMVQILVDTAVQNLIQDEDGRIVGVEVKNLKRNDQSPSKLMAPNVVLATGGFAADRSKGSLLAKYRPELLKMPATAGEFSTGDGVILATALGAGTVDMDKVQIHPTGWVNPKDPTNRGKVLAAELMRGVGGILINSQGKRFCNELGTRAYVTDMMLSHDPYYAENKKWNEFNEIPTFSLVLSSSAAEDGKKHVDHYTHKGLLTRIQGVSALAEWMGVEESEVRSTLEQYQRDAKAGTDAWGKTSFRGLPQADLDNEVFYAGTVTPVLHYCMGGITIDTEGNVLNENRTAIPGLHAAGEVSGGVHGNNRLGGNSLLECTVYGTIVGKKIPVKSRTKTTVVEVDEKPKTVSRDITSEELARHNSDEDCWVAVEGTVYDLTDFAEEHPAGAESIHRLAGQDGTEAFQAVHNSGIMEDFDDVKMGTLV